MPPLTEVAVNATGVPGQVLFCDAAILTAGVTKGLTFMAMLLLVAVLPVAQLALLVIMQLILSPLAKLLLLKVTLFVPALLPFINH